MRRRRITPEQVAQRDELLKHITTEKPLSTALQEFKSAEGFHALFCRISGLYPNNIEAYEALEEQHLRIFGHRKYSEYDSFRSSIMQRGAGKKKARD